MVSDVEGLLITTYICSDIIVHACNYMAIQTWTHVFFKRLISFQNIFTFLNFGTIPLCLFLFGSIKLQRVNLVTILMSSYPLNLMSSATALLSDGTGSVNNRHNRQTELSHDSLLVCWSCMVTADASTQEKFLKFSNRKNSYFIFTVYPDRMLHVY